MAVTRLVVACVCHRYGEKPSSTIKQFLIDQSTKNSIIDNIAGTPNRVLFTPFHVP